MGDGSDKEVPLSSIVGDPERFSAEMTRIIKSPFFVELIEELKYPNFEPVKMRQMIMTKAGMEDIVFLCKAGITFGNNTNRIISSMHNATIRTRFVLLKKRLQIKDSTMNNPKVVTLSRVLACFPEEAVRILQVDNPPMKVPHEELKLIHEEFPPTARTPAAASVLPYSLTMREAQHALALITVPSLKTSELINARCPKWMAKTREDKVDTTFEYVRRCFNSDVLSRELRVSKAVEFGMVVENGGVLALTPAWRAAGAAAAAWLKSEYDFDFTETLHLEMIMNKVETEPTH